MDKKAVSKDVARHETRGETSNRGFGRPQFVGSRANTADPEVRVGEPLSGGETAGDGPPTPIPRIKAGIYAAASTLCTTLTPTPTSRAILNMP